MPKGSDHKGDFSAGELSKLLGSRINTDAYAKGAKVLENIIVTPQGPIINRAGFQFIKEVKFSDKITRIIEFVFAELQAYVIELGDLYARFYRNGAAIVEAPFTITDITQANPAVVTISSASAYVDDDSIFISTVVGMTEVNNKFHTINQLTTTTFELVGVDSTGFTAYSSGGTAEKHHEIVTPWLATEVEDIQFAQDAETMFLAQVEHKSQVLTRSDHDSWTIVDYAPTADPFTGAGKFPRAIIIYEQRLVWGGTKDDPQKIFSTKAGNFNDMTLGSNDADAWVYVLGSKRVNTIRWLFGEDFIEIGTFGGVHVARGSSLEASITPSNVSVRLNAAAAAAAEAPVLVQDVTLYIQRLGKKVLALGFDGVKNKFTTRDATLRSKGVTGNGIKQLAYQEEPDSVVWMVREDGQLVGFTIEFAETINAWHRHITEGKFKSIAVIPEVAMDELWAIIERTVNGQTVQYVELQKERDDSNIRKTLFFVDAGLCYEGDAFGIDAAATLTPAAVTGLGINFVASNAVFTAADVGKVLINETTVIINKKIVKLLGNATITVFNSSTSVDADITQDFPDANALAAGNWSIAINQVSNLEFLEGKTVTLLVDGATHTDQVVTDGSISLNVFGSFICIGLGYESEMVALKVEAASGDGTAQGKFKRISEADIEVIDTSGISVSASEIAGEDLIETRTAADLMDQPPPLFTGLLPIKSPQGGWNRAGSLVIRQTLPLPMTITGYTLRLTTNDG